MIDIYAERLKKCGISCRKAYCICLEYAIRGDYEGLDRYIEMMERIVYVD